MQNNLQLINPRVFVILLFLFLLSFGTLSAQTKTISGIITGEGIPLPGVTISIKGAEKATISDFEGYYSIDADKGNILVFQFTGYKTTEVKIENKIEIDVKMINDVSKLQEVLVIGYGTQKRSEITGAISSVKGEELKKISSSNFQNALQGKVAGLSVVATGGEPGAAPIIQIRGTNTLNTNRKGQFPGDPNQNLQNPTTSGLSPLYVVDGIPFDNNPNISSNDIESVEVLKDAATTAIYGTRAGAGVILITTKRGQKGDVKVNFTSYVGFDKITSRLDLVNTADAFLIHRTNHDNNNLPDQAYFSLLQVNRDALKYDVDWQKFVLNDYAPLWNSNLNLSGGNKDINYNLSLDHFNQNGSFKKSELERTNLRGNAGLKKGKFSAWISMNTSFSNRKLAPWGLLNDAIFLAPYNQPFKIGSPDVNAPVGAVNSDGSAIASTNTVASGLSRKFAQESTRNEKGYGANISLTYSILENLKAKLNISGNRSTNNSLFYNPLQQVFSDEDGSLIENRTIQADLLKYISSYQSFLKEATLDYDKYFGKHRLGLLVGASEEERIWEEVKLGFNTFLSPTQRTISGASKRGISSEVIFPTKSNSYLGRFKYEYDEKYFLLANARRDGSSKFSKLNRIGYFWGISGGWNVSKERFFKNANFLSSVNNLKFRASYGSVGNDRIGDFRFISTLGVNQNPVFKGVSPTGASRVSIGNENLQWETSITTNYGVDLDLFKSAFSINADYYIVEKKGLLYDLVPVLSAGVGKSSIATNIASLQNKGLELAASYTNQKNKFKWTISGTFSKNENTILSLDGVTNDKVGIGFPIPSVGNRISATPVTFLKPGSRAGDFFLIPTDGIINTQEELDEYKSKVTEILGDKKIELGDLKYTDTTGDGIINDEDRVFAGHNTPDFEAGLNVNFEYKNFDFSMQWFGAFGHSVYNGPKLYAYASGTHKDIAYQWSAKNPNTNIPKAGTALSVGKNVNPSSDLFLEDGDFIRLRNLQIGYTVPNKHFKNLGINKFRIYASTQNLLTITKYSGFDPEIGGDGLATKGIDSTNQPITARGLMGFEIGF